MMKIPLQFCLAAVSAAFAAHCAFGIAASQAWVENFVSNYVANSAAEVQANTTTSTADGTTTITTPTGGTMTVEPSTDAALRATNCTASAVSASVTNGTLFVRNGAGEYVNPAGSVTATATNLVWRGIGGVASNGLECFAGWFDVRGVRIQPTTSFAVTNALQETAR